jgi:uncharacterized membrane protein
VDSESQSASDAQSDADQPSEAQEGPAQPDLGVLVGATVGMMRDAADLVAIELEMAARSLVVMIVLAIVLAGIAVMAWLLILAAMGAYLSEGPGLDWPWVFLVLGLINLGVGVLVWFAVRHFAVRLGFPGVRAILQSTTHHPGRVEEG